MIDDNYIPDFSGDDFSNDKGIQETRALRKAYEKMIEESFAILKTSLSIKEGSHKNLKHFMMFKSLEPIITKSYCSKNPNSTLQVSLARYSSSFPTAKSNNAGEDQYLFGYFKTKNAYPKTYVHKETIREKIVDLFLKREVDFEHSKKFSRRFHVLTENKEKLETLFQFKNLDALAEYPEMEIELNGFECLYRSSRKPISTEEAEIFCELTEILVSLLS